MVLSGGASEEAAAARPLERQRPVRCHQRCVGIRVGVGVGGVGQASREALNVSAPLREEAARLLPAYIPPEGRTRQEGRITAAVCVLLLLRLELLELLLDLGAIGNDLLQAVGLVPYACAEEDALARRHRHVVLGEAARTVKPEPEQALVATRVREERPLHAPASRREADLLLAVESHVFAAAAGREDSSLRLRPDELLALRRWAVIKVDQRVDEEPATGGAPALHRLRHPRSRLQPDTQLDPPRGAEQLGGVAERGERGEGGEHATRERPCRGERVRGGEISLGMQLIEKYAKRG